MPAHCTLYAHLVLAKGASLLDSEFQSKLPCFLFSLSNPLGGNCRRSCVRSQPRWGGVETRLSLWPRSGRRWRRLSKRTLMLWLVSATRAPPSSQSSSNRSPPSIFPRYLGLPLPLPCSGCTFGPLHQHPDVPQHPLESLQPLCPIVLLCPPAQQRSTISSRNPPLVSAVSTLAARSRRLSQLARSGVCSVVRMSTE